MKSIAQLKADLETIMYSDVIHHLFLRLLVLNELGLLDSNCLELDKMGTSKLGIDVYSVKAKAIKDFKSNNYSLEHYKDFDTAKVFKSLSNKLKEVR